jgi:hypothetical protein
VVWDLQSFRPFEFVLGFGSWVQNFRPVQIDGTSSMRPAETVIDGFICLAQSGGVGNMPTGNQLMGHAAIATLVRDLKIIEEILSGWRQDTFPDGFGITQR